LFLIPTKSEERLTPTAKIELVRDENNEKDTHLYLKRPIHSFDTEKYYQVRINANTLVYEIVDITNNDSIHTSEPQHSFPILKENLKEYFITHNFNYRPKIKNSKAHGRTLQNYPTCLTETEAPPKSKDLFLKIK